MATEKRANPPQKTKASQSIQEDSKHTPGPWMISPASTSSATWDEIYSSDMKTLICSMDMCKSKLVKISETEHQLEDTDEIDEAIANANLIASAPKLKAENEALKEANKELVNELKDLIPIIESTFPEQAIVWLESTKKSIAKHSK